jgi:hypothetical protein
VELWKENSVCDEYAHGNLLHFFCLQPCDDRAAALIALWIGSGKFLRKILTNSDSKCFNGKTSCRAYTHALRSHSLRCAHTPPSARSSGRTAFPVDIPDDMMYEIAVDSDPDKLPTTHACIGLVRPFILMRS